MKKEPLPIHSILPGLHRALSERSSVILQAPPGAGKTTAVPLSLLEAPWLGGKKILMLEPRRLAARNAAYRMAALLGEEAGETVGYRIRQETKVSARTRIEVVTEGILTRMLQSDPALEAVGVLIFDEFHERSIHADLGLALALQSQALLRDDLKLIVMSATLNAENLREIMPDAAVTTSEGKCHPVTFRYLDIHTKQPDAKTVAALAAETVLEAMREEPGSALVFLPGVAEIRSAEYLLRASVGDDCMVATLYGDLSRAAQQHAIAPAPEGKRKIVLATNIAETSLTIEGVRIVVDSGLERYAEYDAASGMNRMRTRLITQDSAVQRAGRAGRTQSGVCWRLWHAQKALVPHARPEILQSDLAPLMLELAKWGAAADELSWVDRPPRHAAEEAEALLSSLATIDGDGRITRHGEEAVGMGVHPRFAHMLLGAKAEGLGYEAVLLVTLLQERTGFSGTDLDEGIVWLDRALQTGACGSVLSHAVNVLKKRLGVQRVNEVRSVAGELTALAYPERIAKRRSKGSPHFLLANGKGAVLADETHFLHDEYLAVAEAGGQGEPLRIYHAAALTEAAIRDWFPDTVQTESSVVWNDEAGRVAASEVSRLGAVVLERRRIDDPSPELVMRGVMEGIKRRGLDSALPWDKKSLSLRERSVFVNANLPGTFPDLDDEALLETMPEWLAPYLQDVRDLKGLQKLDLAAILSAMLGWEALQRLDAMAPESITVPSGSKIGIDYGDPTQPILAVRLQEVFGWQNTPTVLEGRIPLMLHLLSPAQRPVQMTKDLASFWKEGYADVRKELRGRYPKHYWPEDPYEAVATSRTKKGMGLK